MVRITLPLALSASAAVSAVAIPRGEEAAASPALDDPAILNFALTLEHLESAFYTEALKNYTDDDFNTAGFSGVRNRIMGIAADEAQHVTFLTAALKAAGASPVGASSYMFPSTDVKSFLGLSQILEGVGVAAYLGAAPSIASKAYLGAAGSILTVEARHNAFIRDTNMLSPFPGPEDAALSPRSIVTLAAAFFVPGAKNAPTIMPFPSLAVVPASPSNITAGTMVNAKAGKTLDSKATVYCAFVSGLQVGYSKRDASHNCKIPTTNVTAGQTYVLLTSSTSLSDSSTIAGPGIIEVRDAMN